LFMYAVKSGYDPHPPPSGVQNSGALKVSEGRKLGGVGSLFVSNKQPVWLATNVLPFPWNRLTLDGHLIPSKTIRVGRMDGFSDWMLPSSQVIPVPAGAHTVGYQFRPTRTWKNLRILSDVVLVAWFGLAACWGLRRLFAGLTDTFGRIRPGTPSDAFRPQSQADAKVSGD
jgi:hypothetical protein